MDTESDIYGACVQGFVRLPVAYLVTHCAARQGVSHRATLRSKAASSTQPYGDVS